MKIILKGCTKDVIDDICEQLGSQTILNCEQRGIYEDYEPIYEIELDSAKCLLHVFPDWIYIIRTDVVLVREMTIADFRFEEVIIK